MVGKCKCELKILNCSNCSWPAMLASIAPIRLANKVNSKNRLLSCRNAALHVVGVCNVYSTHSSKGEVSSCAYLLGCFYRHNYIPVTVTWPNSGSEVTSTSLLQPLKMLSSAGCGLERER